MPESLVLRSGHVVYYDTIDKDRIERHHWGLRPDARKRDLLYAGSTINGKDMKMHRFILEAPKGLVVDHRDGNGLNNCRSNIRLCTVRENIRNTRSRPHTSKFRGVSWFAKCKRWRAQITVDDRKIYLGLFEDEVDAALAYDFHAKVHHGEFASLNFPSVEVPQPC